MCCQRSDLDTLRGRAAHLDPERGTLADRGELRGLEVGPSEGREVLVLLGKLAQSFNDDGEFREDDVAGVAEEDEVGVVGNVARSRSQVDNSGGGRGVEAKDVNVRHDVVATLLLLDGSLGHLLLIEVLEVVGSDIVKGERRTERKQDGQLPDHSDTNHSRPKGRDVRGSPSFAREPRRKCSIRVASRRWPS